MEKGLGEAPTSPNYVPSHTQKATTHCTAPGLKHKPNHDPKLLRMTHALCWQGHT